MMQSQTVTNVQGLISSYSLKKCFKKRISVHVRLFGTPEYIKKYLAKNKGIFMNIDLKQQIFRQLCNIAQ